jgi:prephenate dehydrogenase
MLCQKLTLVGVGLLGGSLGLALRERGLVSRVEGFVRRAASVEECERLGAVDRATLDLAAAVTDADLVVLCTPLAQMHGLAAQMLPALKKDALVTDVGSVKGAVVRDLEPLLAGAGAQFVGSHPMAGAEKTGVAHARGDLFQDAVCAVTPTRKTPAEAVRRVRELWRAVGARTLRLAPELHDELVSRSSHLPHVVAAELANYVLSPAHSKEQAALCGNGFRDTTRIASSSTEMWRDIALANRHHLSRVLGVFIEDLQEFRHALDTPDAGAIAEFFEKARQRREAWCAQTETGE